MKKIVFSFIILMVLLSNGYTQDSVLTSKRGIPILPQAGDWAIGIDARPFTQIFNSNSDVGFEFINDHLLIGKKFIKNNLAHRGKLRIAFDSYTDDEYTIKDGQDVPDPTITVTDTRVTNLTNITLGYGNEKRTGYGRLQILYGGEVLISYDTYSQSYTYGNSFSMSNPDPTSHNFGSNLPYPGSRVSFYEQGFAITAAIRAFLGVEYFFAPKISVGGEFGWGVSYTNIGEGSENVQSWDAGTNTVKTDIYKSGGSSIIGFDNDNFGGAIYFMFHFK